VQEKMSKSEKMGPNQAVSASNSLTANIDWSAFTSEEGQVLVTKGQALGKFLTPHIREFLAQIASAAAEILAYRFEPLPQELDGENATLKTAMAAVAKDKGSVSLYKLWRENESLIPEGLKLTGKVIIFPETEFDFGVIQCVRYLRWNGSCWSWSFLWVSCRVDSNYFVAVPASIP
jgi:hypothetical protein